MEALFKALMLSSAQQKKEIVEQALAACENQATKLAQYPEYARAMKLAKLYPGDIGIVVSLLLNPLRLDAGQGVYLPARTLHMYLHGFGVEIMAASDNVLRGGLTPKHVDVDELLRVLRFDAFEARALVPRLHSGSASFREELYLTEAAEFSLARLVLTHAAPLASPEHHGPEILLLTEGAVTVRGSGDPIALAPGDSAFVAAGERYALEGVGVVFRAGVDADRNPVD
jgi:mannose-6-phosphate isomerase